MNKRILCRLALAVMALSACDNNGRDHHEIPQQNNNDLQPGDCADENGNVEACGPDEVCRGGHCIPRGGCVRDAECSAGQHCDPNRNECVALQCDDGNTCTNDGFQGNACNHTPIPGCCNAQVACPQGGVCDPETSRCVGCLDSDDCQDNQFCAGNQCTPVGDCADGNLCTRDRPRAHQCANDRIPGCCTNTDQCLNNQECDLNTNLCVALRCDDNNICTNDHPAAAPHTCAHDPIANCCTRDADCGAGTVCDLESNRCVGCVEDEDCPDEQQCNEAAQVCVALACDDGNICTADQPVDNRCVNTPIAGCCRGDADCASGACGPNNRCVECVNDRQCAEDEICRGNVCTSVICAPANACDAPIVQGQQCRSQNIPQCCLGPNDDNRCRRACANDGQCRAGESCQSVRGQFICAPIGLPAGYDIGCPTEPNNGQNGFRCTTCSNRDAQRGSNLCSLYERCGNGWDDDGDGQVDEGVRTPQGRAPDESVNCVGCIGDADCGAGQVCDLFTRECINRQNPMEVCDGIDNDNDGVIDDGATCAAGQVCRDGRCQAGPLPELCNGLDDDQDGQVDDGASCPQGEECRNGACRRIPQCQVNADCAEGAACVGGFCQALGLPAQCSDGIDNDMSGRFDCADPACAGAPACNPQANQNHVLEWWSGDNRNTENYDMYAFCVLPPDEDPYLDWDTLSNEIGRLERGAGFIRFTIPLPDRVSEPFCITNLRNNQTGLYMAGCLTDECPDSESVGQFRDTVRGGPVRIYQLDGNGLDGKNFFSPNVPQVLRP